MYGTQFHSELDKRREAERLIKYRSYYVDQLHSEAVFQEVMDSLRETTDVDHLMYDFLRRFAVRA
jgi:GMP synthase (glutamine-hydrolysing)